jgi:hypothetical protein
MDSLGAEVLKQRQTGAGCLIEREGVDAHATREKTTDLVDAAVQELHGAAPVAPVEVMEGDPDLENALVECAYRISLSPPDVLENLVALKVFSSVEEFDPFEQPLRRPLTAPSIGHPILPLDYSIGEG